MFLFFDFVTNVYVILFKFKIILMMFLSLLIILFILSSIVSSSIISIVNLGLAWNEYKILIVS